MDISTIYPRYITETKCPQTTQTPQISDKGVDFPNVPFNI